MDAGWHRDPFGRFAQRYHDGMSWTEHVSDGSGSAIVDPSGSGPGAPGGVAEMTQPSPSAAAVGGTGGAGGFRALPGSPVLRFVARLIDGLLIGLPLSLLFSSAGVIEVDFETGDTDVNVGAYIVITLVYAAYEIGMIGSMGRTVGKMVCGLTVVRRSTAELPGYPIAAVRWLVWLIYGIPMIGWLLFIVTVIMGFSGSLRQTIHDKVAGTVVAKSSTL